MRNGTGITADTFTSSGSSGDVTVEAGSLEMRHGAGINIFGPGAEGNVTVTADRVFLSGDGAFFTGIFVLGGRECNSDRRQSGGAQWGSD
jgi:hypothetical protein